MGLQRVRHNRETNTFISLKVEHVHSTLLSNSISKHTPHTYIYTYIYSRKDMYENIQNTNQNTPKEETTHVSISKMDEKHCSVFM